MPRLGALFLVAALTLSVGLTLAPKAAAAANATADAKAAYDRGTVHFKARDFGAALADFEKAYKLDPSPVLLYNIARCHEEMGEVDKAKANFTAYLKRVPNAPDRADVERRIRVMEAVAARTSRAPVTAAGAPGVGDSVQPRSSGPSALVWGVLGAGTAAIIAGAIFGLHATDLDTQYTEELDDPRRKRTLADDAEAAALRANIGYGVGGALLAAGVLLWVLDDDAPGVAPTATPGGFGIVGRF